VQCTCAKVAVGKKRFQKSFLRHYLEFASKPQKGISVSIRLNVHTKDSFAKKDHQLFKKQTNRLTILSSFRWADKCGGVKAIIGKKDRMMPVESNGNNVWKSKDTMRCWGNMLKNRKPVANLKRKWKESKVARHFVREIVIRQTDYRKVP